MVEESVYDEFVERAEKRIVRAANGGEAESAKEKDIKCDIPGCKESFRSRQGLNSHKTKDHNKGIHVVSDSEEDEKYEYTEDDEEDDRTWICSSDYIGDFRHCI